MATDSTASGERSPVQMDSGMEGWLLRTARKNYWRVASWYDLDDLIQEGYECFYEVLKRYPTVKDKPHVMRLFMLVYTSRITDLANKRTRQPDHPVDTVVDVAEASYWDWLASRAGMIQLPSDDCSGSAAELGLVRRVLDALERVPGEELRAPYARYADGRRETLNDRLRRLAGIAADVDVVGAMRACLRAV